MKSERPGASFRHRSGGLCRRTAASQKLRPEARSPEWKWTPVLKSIPFCGLAARRRESLPGQAQPRHRETLFSATVLKFMVGVRL